MLTFQPITIKYLENKKIRENKTLFFLKQQQQNMI